MAEHFEDDDFNLYPSGKSRLSNLFPTQHVDENNVNQSLTYVAPKQPKKTDGQQQSSAENLKLIHAVAAYTYKLEGGQYKTQGKFGVAVLGDHNKHVYKLLLYKGKQQTITVSTIQPDFKLTVEPNNYAKFPDDRGEQWSITFDSEIELINFTKQVAVAKASSFGKTLSILVVQDLAAGDDAPSEAGDALEISLTGNMFTNFSFGEVFDNSAKNGKRTLIELGKPNIPKGWNDGLASVKKGLRRLLIMPASFSYDAGNLPNSLTANDIIIFEVFVHKIKRSANQSQSPSAGKTRGEKKPEVPPRTHSVSNDDIRSRGASLSEQLTQSPRKDNAQLISRIAKIGGTNIFGQNPTGVQTSSESEPEKEIEPEPVRSRKPSGASPKHIAEMRRIEQEENAVFQPRRNVSSQSTAIPVIQNTPLPYTVPQSSAESFQYLTQPYRGLSHMIPSMMPSAVPSLMENHLPLLVAETRTQNTEMRMTLGKLNDKVDTVIQKIDDMRLSQGHLRMPGPAPYMESVILAQNIERVVQENVQMKSDIEAKHAKIQELNEKVCDILQRNQRFFEESNSILEQKSDKMSSNSAHFESQIQNLELEKAKLFSELKESMSKTREIQLQLQDLQKQVQESQGKLEASEADSEIQKEVIRKLENQNKENKTLLETLQGTIESLKQEKQQLASELQISRNRYLEAESTVQQMESKLVQLSKSLDVDAEMKSLQKDLQKALEYKRKFEILYENSRHMKSKYELQVSQLIAENAKKSKSEASATTDFSTEIRKAMNKLYKFLQNEIQKERRYSGTEVLDVCLSVIKRTTFAILGKGQMHGDDSKERSQSERSLSEKSQPHENPSKRSQSDGDSISRKPKISSEAKRLSEQKAKNEDQHISSQTDNSKTKVVEHSSEGNESEENLQLQENNLSQNEVAEPLSSGDQPLLTKLEAAPVPSGENTILSSKPEAPSEMELAPATPTKDILPEISVPETGIGDAQPILESLGNVNQPTDDGPSSVPTIVNSIADSNKEDTTAQLDHEMEDKTTEAEDLKPKKPTPIEEQEHHIPDTAVLKADSNKCIGSGNYGNMPHVHPCFQTRSFLVVVLITLLFSLLLYLGAFVDDMAASTLSSTTL